MRVIKSDSGFLAYQKIFRHIQSNHSPLVIWQVRPQSGERNISESRLNSFHLETKLLHFELPSDYEVESSLPLYCYSEDGQFIFKTDIKDIKNNVFSLQVPEEIKLLEDPDVTFIKGASGVDLAPVWRTKRLNLDEEKPDMVVKSMSERTSRDQDYLNMEFQLTLDEEDKMYADKRETPRARPKVDKFVKVIAETGDITHYMKLFDLSQGGMGFVTLEPELFPKGSKVLVMGFDEFDLDDPLIGQVMSHRPIDDTQIEFKIGCKFDEGQD